MRAMGSRRVDMTPARTNWRQLATLLALPAAAASKSQVWVQLQSACPGAMVAECADEWPRACWQGNAVNMRWGFAVASMAALLAQHGKIWRRQSSKGVSIAMVCLGSASQTSELVAKLLERLHRRSNWQAWDLSDPALTPLVVQTGLALLWTTLFMHVVYRYPARSAADVWGREYGIRLLGSFGFLLLAFLCFLGGLLAAVGPCGLTVDIGCMSAAAADGLILCAWIPQLHLSAKDNSVGAMSIPGALVGGVGGLGAAATLSDCAIAGPTS